MRVKCISKSIDLITGKEYEVMSIEKGRNRVIVVLPFSNDYLYSPEVFEIVEDLLCVQSINPILGVMRLC